MSANGYSPQTLRAYRSDIVGFFTAMPGHSIQAAGGPLTEALCKEYLNNHRDVWSARTLKRKASALRAFGRFLGDPKFLAEYRVPKPSRAVPHPLPEGADDVLCMIAKAHTVHHRALLALTGLAGLRVGEALAVEAGDIQDYRLLLVRGKGNKQRIIPLSDLAWSFIKPAYDQAEGSTSKLVPISDRGARAFITRCGRRAAVERPVASHDLRSTFLTEAYKNSKDLRITQELAGHASPDTTVGYTGVEMDAMRKAASF